MSIGNVNNYTYDYDTYGRLNKIATPAGDFTYTRPADSDLVTAMARPNNVTSNWTFEEHRNLLASVTNGSVSTYTYTNDALGRRTNVTRSGSAFSDTNILTYGYNSRSEVISALSNINANYSFSYNYDPIGNRLNSTLAGTAWSYTSNNLNQYTALTSGNTTQSPAYDADGNMTFRDGWTQIWNGENRLVEMYNDTTKLTFSYDYMGRRIEKKVFQQTGGIWAPQKSLQYVYDGYKLIEEIDTLPDEKPVIRRYTWQPESQGADLPLVVTDVASDQSYFYTADGNKNISELVDATGNIAAHYEYDPFGKINTQNGAYAASNPFRFSSEYFDSETGLVYYNYRYYSPELGRWINRDPIGEAGGLNLYNMLKNNAISQIDQYGLWDDMQDQTNPNSPFNPNNPYNTLPPPLTLLEKFMEWYNNEKNNMNWVKRLKPCPKHITKDIFAPIEESLDYYLNATNRNQVPTLWNSQYMKRIIANPDPNEWELQSTSNFLHPFAWVGPRYHPGGAYELRTKRPSNYGGSGNQCIYDKCGNLITEIPTAGTADKVSPNSSMFLHRNQDVIPFDWAQKLGLEYIYLYYEVRPSW